MHGFARCAGLLGMLLFVACEGPMGPDGAVGPEGPAGPGTRLTFSGQFDANGEAQATLPAEAGTTADPPVVTCYISDVQSGPFLVFATDTSSGVICGFGTVGGSLSVILLGAPAGWHYRIVVVY